MSTQKQLELMDFYRQMARDGVDRGQSSNAVPSDYSLMNIRMFKAQLLPLFQALKIVSVLDYGCGKTNWDVPGFHDEMTARQFFGVNDVHLYEPGLGLDDRVLSDAVVCFDVLEHVFIADVSSVVWDLFSHARVAVICNVACYPARAILPNGENAHVSVRPPMWWKGVFDAVAPAFPDVLYRLYASTSYGEATFFSDTCVNSWLEGPGYERPL
jgi:hypothetical protein